MHGKLKHILQSVKVNLDIQIFVMFVILRWVITIQRFSDKWTYYYFSFFVNNFVSEIYSNVIPKN